MANPYAFLDGASRRRISSITPFVPIILSKFLAGIPGWPCAYQNGLSRLTFDAAVGTTYSFRISVTGDVAIRLFLSCSEITSPLPGFAFTAEQISPSRAIFTDRDEQKWARPTRKILTPTTFFSALFTTTFQFRLVKCRSLAATD